MPEPVNSTPTPFDAARFAKAVRQRLQSLKRSGVSSVTTATGQGVDLSELQNHLATIARHGLPSMEQELPAAESAVTPVVAESVQITAVADSSPIVSASDANPTAVPNDPVMPSKKHKELDLVCQDVADCTACAELAATRISTVFGVGNPNARLVFYGEAPGADEDKQGEPFVGRAGKLLNKIIEAMGLSREEIYILNTIKCRPPGNRNPTPAEQQNCSGFLQRQLEIIQPEYIVCLGAIASHSFLDCKTPIGKMRGQFFEKNGSKVLCTFHPAYLLRDPRRKRDVWDDMQFLMKDMGLPIPRKSKGVE